MTPDGFSKGKGWQFSYQGMQRRCDECCKPFCVMGLFPCDAIHAVQMTTCAFFWISLELVSHTPQLRYSKHAGDSVPQSLGNGLSAQRARSPSGLRSSALSFSNLSVSVLPVRLSLVQPCRQHTFPRALAAGGAQTGSGSQALLVPRWHLEDAQHCCAL